MPLLENVMKEMSFTLEVYMGRKEKEKTISKKKKFSLKEESKGKKWPHI